MNIGEELNKILSTVSNQHDFEDAIQAIGKLNSESGELFELLWNRAIKIQSEGGHVLISAMALYKLNIDCPLSPQKAIEDLCLDWDISIEEVPWYLANQFTKEVILDLTEEMSSTTEEQNVRLSTIKYWVEMIK